MNVFRNFLALRTFRVAETGENKEKRVESSGKAAERFCRAIFAAPARGWRARGWARKSDKAFRTRAPFSFCHESFAEGLSTGSGMRFKGKLKESPRVDFSFKRRSRPRREREKCILDLGRAGGNVSVNRNFGRDTSYTMQEHVNFKYSSVSPNSVEYCILYSGSIL